MLLIKCPWCGPRDQVEFTYGRDAATPYPDLGNGDADAWMDYVYLRPNPKGMHAEFWHHSAGCRQWIRVERDTVSHEIVSAAPPSETRG